MKHEQWLNTKKYLNHAIQLQFLYNKLPTSFSHRDGSPSVRTISCRSFSSSAMYVLTFRVTFDKNFNVQWKIYYYSFVEEKLKLENSFLYV